MIEPRNRISEIALFYMDLRFFYTLRNHYIYKSYFSPYIAYQKRKNGRHGDAKEILVI